MKKTAHRNCPYCGANNGDQSPTAFGSADWPIKKCVTCRFVYIERAPVYERLVDEFAWEKTSRAETHRKLSEEPIKQSISRYLKAFRHRWMKRNKLPWLVRRYITPGNVLDVGCGDGGAISELDSIHIPHGIEISRALASFAQERISDRGGRVVHNDALSGLGDFPSDYFSGVLLSAFLEHEMNPAALLAEVHRTLLPQGRCIIKVPNFGSLNRKLRKKKWCGFRLPDHVNYFTPENLAGMCNKAGFNIEKFDIADRLPTSDNMWIVIQKPSTMAIADSI